MADWHHVDEALPPRGEVVLGYWPSLPIVSLTVYAPSAEEPSRWEDVDGEPDCVPVWWMPIELPEVSDD